MMPEYNEEDFKPAENEIDKKTIRTFDNHCSVGDLKRFFEDHNMPDDAPVVIQRIPDWYFRKGGWATYRKMQDGHEQEYRPAWCPVFYPEDPDILFIDLHY